MSDRTTLVGPKVTPVQADTDLDENSVVPEVAERLRKAVASAGGVAEVSRRSGVPLRTLGHYLKGRDMKRGPMVALAETTGVSLDWLATGRGEMPFDPAIGSSEFLRQALAKLDTTKAVKVPPGFRAIPRYNVTASAGDGSALADHDQVVEYFAFQDDFLKSRLRRRAEDLALIEARGDSMEPTIRDGDILTIDLSPDHALENGRLYVLRVEETLLVKRLELRLDGSLVVHSDNERYGPETVARADLEKLHILGQVLMVSTPPR